MNRDVLYKVIILFSYSIFMFYILVTNKVAMYMHPKMNDYILACGIVFMLIGIIMCKNLFMHSHSSKGLAHYGIFIIPLVLAVCIQPASLGSTVAQSRGITISRPNPNTAAGSGAGSKSAANVTIQETDKKEFEVKSDGENIIVTDKNFLNTMDQMYMEIGKYEGKTIELIGYVFIDETMKENNFVIARSMISCCAADTSIVGLLCDYQATDTLKKDTWVKVKGKIKQGNHEGESMPIVEVEQCTVVEKPKNEYVYP